MLSPAGTEQEQPQPKEFDPEQASVVAARLGYEREVLEQTICSGLADKDTRLLAACRGIDDTLVPHLADTANGTKQ